MCREQSLESSRVDLAVDEQTAGGPFEIVHGLLAVEDLDLGDEPIESQPHRGIRDPVSARDFLQRTGREDKAFEKRDVFVVQQIDPISSVHFHIIKLELNKIKA